MKNKLFDPRYIGGLALTFLLICFIDVLFVTDATSIAGMTVWGQFSIWGFLISLGWIAIFMMVIPVVYKIFGKK